MGFPGGNDFQDIGMGGGSPGNQEEFLQLLASFLGGQQGGSLGGFGGQQGDFGGQQGDFGGQQGGMEELLMSLLGGGGLGSQLGGGQGQALGSLLGGGALGGLFNGGGQ